MNKLPYSISDAQVQMTLSAIAYTTPDMNCKPKPGDKTTKSKKPRNPTAAELTAQLNKSGIATNQEWSLAWGPLTSSSYDNMIFVAQKTGQSVYSIVIRGTVFDSFDSWLGDLPTEQVYFSRYTDNVETCVSNGFMDMFNDMQDATFHGQTLKQYLDGLATNNADLTLYVTGHSQGAGLMPLFLAWVMTEAKTCWNNTALSTAGYGFAPPTAGCTGFATWMQQNAASYLVINPNDIVPFGYAKIGDIRSQGVPTTVPEHIVVDGIKINLWDALSAAADAMWLVTKEPLGCGPWAQAGDVTILPGEADPRSGDDYFDQVEVQHNHNSYLVLLGAAQTDIPDKSPFTPPST